MECPICKADVGVEAMDIAPHADGSISVFFECVGCGGSFGAAVPPKAFKEFGMEEE